MLLHLLAWLKMLLHLLAPLRTYLHYSAPQRMPLRLTALQGTSLLFLAPPWTSPSSSISDIDLPSYIFTEDIILPSCSAKDSVTLLCLGQSPSQVLHGVCHYPCCYMEDITPISCFAQNSPPPLWPCKGKYSPSGSKEDFSFTRLLVYCSLTCWISLPPLSPPWTSLRCYLCGGLCSIFMLHLKHYTTLCIPLSSTVFLSYLILRILQNEFKNMFSWRTNVARYI